MLVSNHKSMIDVFLMLKVSSAPFIFVGKKELLKLPIFGFFYKKFAIMVNRDSAESRKAVYGHAERRLSQGLGICIFPEGGVFGPEVKLAPFKNGAFAMALEKQIPILPVSLIGAYKIMKGSFFISWSRCFTIVGTGSIIFKSKIFWSN